MLRRRPLLTALAVVAFLAISLGMARFLTAEGGQRGQVLDLLQAQGRGDVAAVLEQLEDCEGECRKAVADSARRAAATATVGRTDVDIVRLDSDVSYSLGANEGWARVVWVRGDSAPVVQCVRVRRRGNPLTGRSSSLLRLSRPLADNQDPC